MKTAAKDKESAQATTEQGKAETLAIEKIEFSSLNYRKYFSQEDVETFAVELNLHGLVSPLIVRILTDGKYQLVAGERRLRAGKIAKLPTAPVIVREAMRLDVLFLSRPYRVQNR